MGHKFELRDAFHCPNTGKPWHDLTTLANNEGFIMLGHQHTSFRAADPLTNYLPEFQLALSEEIAAVRAGGSQKTYLSDGRRLGVRDGLTVYSFSADTELRFPDDTPVDLEYQGRKYSGTIISIDGLTVIIALAAHIGDTIATALLHTDPWFLLQKLQERLGELQHDPSANKHLAAALLRRSAAAQPPDIDQAVNMLRPARKHRGASFTCNTDQLKVVGQVLANPVSFIWGPPGTGKTTTLGMTVAALVESGQSVLVVAHSNVAVDVAMAGIARNLGYSEPYTLGKVLRFGPAALPELDAFPEIQVRGVVRQRNPQLIKQIEELERHRKQLTRRSRQDGLTTNEALNIKDEIARINAQLRPLRDELKQRESELVKQAQVVGCTFSKATIAQEVAERQFDAVIVDEASMAYIPHCVFVASRARQRIAVFGDFRQLAPIAQAETERVQRWLLRDIFDEAGITERVNAGKDDPRMVMLTTQHRMHPEIAAVVNKLFYGSRLKNGPDVAERAAAAVAAEPGRDHALVLYDLLHVQAECFSDKESHSRFNLVSALFAAQAARQCLATGVTSVGIVTPYNAQSRLIRRLLKDLALPDEQVRVATVHRFQGSENQAIVFDAVDGEPQSKPGKLLTGGMGSTAMRLANVAVSRAQGKFIGLFNRSYINSHFAPGEIFPSVVAELSRRSAVLAASWQELRGREEPEKKLPELSALETCPETATAIEGDLVSAREEIAIYWPEKSLQGHFSPHALLRCDPAKVRFFVTGAGSDTFQIGLKNAQIWEGRSALRLGLIGIDRRILWVALAPSERAGMVLRLELPQTVSLLYSFFGLVPDQEIGGPKALDMSCPKCAKPLWLASGKYGAYLMCTGGCGHTKSITPKLATDIARIMGVFCPHCNGQARGRKGYNGVFLGCANYPECRWTQPLDQLV